MSTSYDDCQDIEREPERVALEDKYGRIDLKGKTLTCVARQAERIIDNAEADGEGYVINSDDYDDLAALLDDLRTIEKEGW